MDDQIEEIRRRAFALPSKNLQPNPAKALVFEALALLETARGETRQLQQETDRLRAQLNNAALSRSTEQLNNAASS